MLGDNNTTERKLYTQIYKWSFSIWHVKKIKKISFGNWIISIYYACFSDCNDNEVLLFGKYSVLNTKYYACYSDCKGWRLFFGCFFWCSFLSEVCFCPLMIEDISMRWFAIGLRLMWRQEQTFHPFIKWFSLFTCVCIIVWLIKQSP